MKKLRRQAPGGRSIACSTSPPPVDTRSFPPPEAESLRTRTITSPRRLPRREQYNARVIHGGLWRHLNHPRVGDRKLPVT